MDEKRFIAYLTHFHYYYIDAFQETGEGCRQTDRRGESDRAAYIYNYVYTSILIYIV